MKRKWILVFCICISVLGGGCMVSKDTMGIRGKEALEYICQKYQKEFKADIYEVADYLSNTDKIHCYTEGMDVENEHIEIYLTEKDETISYGDNYFSFYIRPQAEEYIGKIIKSEFEEYKVFRSNEYEAFPNELTNQSDLEDLYRVKEDYWMDVKVYIKGNGEISANEYEEKIQRIEQKLVETNHRYTIYIFVVNDEIYDSMERYTQEEFFRYYAQNRKPDGEKYFYVYKNTIMDGKVI